MDGNDCQEMKEAHGPERVRKVAVIGVHGIARHPAGETQNAMADLLLSLPKQRREDGVVPGDDCGPCSEWSPDAARLYGPFKSVGIQMPLQRVRVTRSPVQEQEAGGFIQRTWKSMLDAMSFEEQSAKFASYQKSMGKAGVNQEGESRLELWDGSQTGNEYTGVLLDQYCGGGEAGGNVYRTARLEGFRDGGSNSDGEQGVSKVDIYEVLWADLAHPESNLVGFLLSLFTLLLHLGSLSRLAIDSGSKRMAKEGPKFGAIWWCYLGSQRWAVRILQALLPIFKVLLLVVLLSAIPGVSEWLAHDVAKKDTGAIAFALSLGLLGVVGVVFIAYFVTKQIRWPLRRNPWIWAISTFVPGLTGVLLTLGLLRIVHDDPQYADSLLCWMLIGTPIVAFILSKYESVRNGVQFWGWTVYLVSLFTFMYLSRWSHNDVSLLAFWMTELGVAAIRICWLMLSAFALAALALGSLAWRMQTKPDLRANLRAAVRTSRFALAMPAVFFLLVTPLIWAAMFKLADWVRNPFFNLNGRENDGNWLIEKLTHLHFIPDAGDPEFICGDYLKSILAWGIGYQLPLTLLLVSLAILLLVWWVVPSALLEGYVLRNKTVPPRSSTNRGSRALGSWLSRGLDATSVITFLFWCSIFLVFPAVYLLGSNMIRLEIQSITTLPILHLTGIKATSTASAVEWLKSFTKQDIVGNWLPLISGATLVAMAKYGSSVLQTILDVDTYLRAAPVDATPRAKIFERFVSTLRYVAKYEDEEGKRYDSVVIVAHSLGSLIAADLLRYLWVGQQESQTDPCSRYDAELARYGFADDQGNEAKLKVKLLTMGSPIRQLLNRFFPYLYDWVRACPDNGLKPLPHPPGIATNTHPISNLPDPAELGLAQWVNTYRSGDYVGRSLWLEEWYQRTPTMAAGAGWYPAAITQWPISGVSGGSERVEMCIGAGAHTRYWDDTAPDVAEVLDEMIVG